MENVMTRTNSGKEQLAETRFSLPANVFISSMDPLPARFSLDTSCLTDQPVEDIIHSKFATLGRTQNRRGAFIRGEIIAISIFA